MQVLLYAVTHRESDTPSLLLGVHVLQGTGDTLRTVCVTEEAKCMYTTSGPRDKSN